MTMRFALILLLVLVQPFSFAQVHRADSGTGGALIVPYWTAASNNDTLMLIRNESDDATVAKVRMLDEEGALLVSFNLYLDARAVWTSAVSIFDGSPGLLMLDVGCVLPADIGGDPGDSLPILALDRPHGSMEIIEMARATEASDLVSSGRWADCDVLADEFESGDWSDDPNAGLEAPAQRLSASANIINVQVGGMDVIAATALGGFSDIAQHTAPIVPTPDLGDAQDTESPAGVTRSMVCVAAGCRTDEWERPIEAVAAVLTVSSMRVDYSVADEIGARFDWMIHRPLERYEDEATGFAIDTLPTITLRTRDGATPEGSDVCIPEQPPGQPPCGQTTELPLDRGLVQQNLAFNAGATMEGSVIESAVLGHPTIVRYGFSLGDVGTSEFDEGTAEVRFDESAEDVQLLVAGDGTVFVGEPVVSFTVQQYTNGTLVDSQGQYVIGNYRGTQLPRRFLRLEAPN